MEWNEMEQQFGIEYERCLGNEMEDVSYGMEDNLPYFHTNSTLSKKRCSLN